jgi:phage terminase small subunit
MPPIKNLRQETFCLEWVKDHDDARAYKAAGYKCGTYNSQHTGAYCLLKTTIIKTRILELERDKRQRKAKAEVKAAEAAAIDRMWVVNKLVENVDRSMQAVAVLDKRGQRTGEYQYEGGVANRGLELIGKDLGMFQDKTEKPGDTYNTQIIFTMPMNARDPLEVVTHASNGHTNGSGNGSGT